MDQVILQFGICNKKLNGSLNNEQFSFRTAYGWTFNLYLKFKSNMNKINFTNLLVSEEISADLIQQEQLSNLFLFYIQDKFWPLLNWYYQ